MNSTLKDALLRTRQISNAVIPSTSVVNKIEDKLEDNIDLRTEVINLRSQVKSLKESEAIQSSEFKFQKDQLIEEINKLKQNEAELRNVIIGLSSEKDKLFDIMNNRSNLDLQLRENSGREAFESLFGQIAALQKENTCLHVENENIVSENKKLKMLNHSLTMHLQSDNNIAEERLNRVRLNNVRDAKIITNLHSMLQTNRSDYLDKISNLENEIMHLRSELHSRTNDLGSSQNQLKTLQLQFNELQSVLEKISEKYQNTKAKNRNLIKSMESIENEKSTNDTEISYLRQNNLKLKSKVKEMQNITYCNPLINERMKVLKVIADDYQLISKSIVRREITSRDLVLVTIFTLRWQKYVLRKDMKFYPSGGLTALANRSFPSLSESVFSLSSNIEFLKNQIQQEKLNQQQIKNDMDKVLDRNREELVTNEARALHLQMLRKCNGMLNTHINTFIHSM